jgi:hypothetical protein
VVCRVQVVRLTVLTDTPPPAFPIPTATHVVGPAHETEVRDDTDGDAKVAQVLPLVVSTIAALEFTLPTATQVVELLQEILLSELRFAGGF